MRVAAAPSAAMAAVLCLGLTTPGTAPADNDTRVTRITHLEDSPSERIPLVTAVPQYPETARRDRIEGEATVCYTIDARGRIRRPTVKHSSHKIFAKPALKAIKQSSYEPLDAKDKATVARACRTYRFFLNPVAIEDVD